MTGGDDDQSQGMTGHPKCDTCLQSCWEFKRAILIAPARDPARRVEKCLICHGCFDKCGIRYPHATYPDDITISIVLVGEQYGGGSGE